jgi:hypothetical protein
MLSRGMLVLAMTLLAPSFGVALAEGVMPKTLVIGYENEGQIDTSAKSCRDFVTEMVEWEEAEINQAAHDICVGRKKHVDAYSALQKAYKAFAAEVSEQKRLDGPEAAAQLALLIKSCIAHKSAISTGGHNVRIDMVPNEIAVSCLSLGTDLLNAETKEFRGE